MGKERVTQYRNTGSADAPLWEKYYPKTVADAVMVSDADNETVHIKGYVDTGLGNKVDKVSGKGLSANDYTTEEKNKLAGIPAGAQVNVKADWNAATGDAQILNKPSALPAKGGNADTVGGKGPSDFATSAQGTKADNALPKSLKGVANGLAELDVSGKVPAAQLPSYVDDVLEFSAKANFPATGESGKIYVDTATNLTWRWSGSGYIEISPSIALGETASTAYRGDRGKVAYDHSQAAHAPVNAQKNVQSDWNATSGDAQILNKPASLPANGGNSTTVNGHTVNSDVPSSAKFTDTVYTLPVGGVSLGGVKNGGNVSINSDGTMSVPSVSDASTAVKGIVQLSSATNSTSEGLAATPKAVKSAYDLANTANTAATNAQNAANTARNAATTAQNTANGKATVVFAKALPANAPADSLCFLID